MREDALLFVYGTLRCGSSHAMAQWLAAKAEWCGPARCPGARLYRVSWYPALVAVAATEAQVQGDLYRLREPAALWPVLDGFEGITGSRDDEYERRRCEIRDQEGRPRQAWSYWYRLPVDALAPIPGGDWLQC